MRSWSCCLRLSDLSASSLIIFRGLSGLSLPPVECSRTGKLGSPLVANASSYTISSLLRIDVAALPVSGCFSLAREVPVLVCGRKACGMTSGGSGLFERSLAGVVAESESW